MQAFADFILQLVYPPRTSVPSIRRSVMFDSPPSLLLGGVTTEPIGDQVRGFGLFHDGTGDSLPSFFSVPGFAQPISPHGFILGPEGDDCAKPCAVHSRVRFQLEAHRWTAMTLTAESTGDVLTRLDLLEARAAAGDCELVVKGHDGTREIGFLYDADRTFYSDQSQLPKMSSADLRQLASVDGIELTYAARKSSGKANVSRSQRRHESLRES